MRVRIKAKEKTFWRIPSDYYGIYDLLMSLTGGDHQASSDAACWCELAAIGEVYECGSVQIDLVDE